MSKTATKRSGRARGTDTQTRFHEEWLGLAQPIEGLVFSVPALAEAQIMPQSGAELSARFRHWVDTGVAGDEPPTIADVQRFFVEFLGYDDPRMLVSRSLLPETLRFYAEEGRQEICPSFALQRGPFERADTDDVFGGFGTDDTNDAQATADTDTPHLMLVWDLRDDAPEVGLGLSLDKPEDHTGPWRYPPTAKFERLLRHTNVPIGLLSNGRALRLVYAPAGETTSHVTFRLGDMAEAAGRPLVAAFELLLGADRAYQAAADHTLEGLLRESRRRQADVTQDLAAQVFEAVEILLEGFEQAAQRETDTTRLDWLRAALEEPGDHLYQGVLSVILRLVFLLYAEDQALLPVGNDFYARYLSIQGLYDELVEDRGMHPESMHHRFGGYGRLLSLFRAVFLGVEHGDLRLPPRRGRLFDPSSFPFLEGGMPETTAAIVSPQARAEVRPPAIDDGVIHDVLSRLILFEGQRLSYRALDVEQIGSVYESLMGYHVVRAASPAARIGKNRVWVESRALRELPPTDRKKFLKAQCGLSTAQQKKVDAALKECDTEEELADALLDLAPGGQKGRDRHWASAGRLVLQPGDERRRSGSHYTPRSLTERIVKRTLEPILACLGEAPTEAQLLSLKICDPAMGSGAFLVEACRHLADQLVATWTREGRVAAVTEEHGDAHLHARRLVAQRCLYGVDKNPAAVELAKLSLWLVTMNADLPFTFIDHTLRHGDSLVGLNLEQIAAFHWKPKKQLELFETTLRDALEQAIAHRQELLRLADREDAGSQDEKRRLLEYAEQATEKIRLVADVCVGAFFTKDKDKPREAERVRRLEIVERFLEGDLEAGLEISQLAFETRRTECPLHWWLEFPEVFYEERPDPLSTKGATPGAAYMEAFVGNPPFLGGRRITEEIGFGYNQWLQLIHNASMNADLCSHFFRRAAVLAGEHGVFGLIATNTIGQGDTRNTGLQTLIRLGWDLYEVSRSLSWPGTAAVTISIVHAARGTPIVKLARYLDGSPASVINSRLQQKPERPDAVSLRTNDGHAFQGCIILGTGFVLDSAEQERLVKQYAANRQRIQRFMGGEDVNTSPVQESARFVINFDMLELVQAEKWPELLTIVRERVRPSREHQKRKHLREMWWRFAESRPAMMKALAPLDRCLVTARVTKHLCFSFQPTDRIFNEKLYVFPLDTLTPFAVLQSRVHEHWTWLLSSTLETRLNYSASDCFDTFPFPNPDPRTDIPEVEAAGQTLYDTRAAFMIETDQGLTKTYNALKDPSNQDEPIVRLRQLHEAMDRAVLDAYGWTDVDVPPYCPTSDAEESQLTEFEDEVIDRLYVLNAERAREEARLGLGTKGKKKKRSAKTKTKSDDSLFQDEAS